ncbi:hypothetical protein [Nocardioides piscis]|uniref:Uncharacterized protein n=1 Tax=Nocardioides piscis TaxID=2714938 RepID=A0A6G7YFM1_9ACTN|nr:hypothetical protein [Nocardioides piscis]QIK75605.1 hypothetical protein G7071_09265 [Nocardioides piscis]
MTQHSVADTSIHETGHETNVDRGARTRGLLGLVLSFVALMGGGVLASGLFYVLLHSEQTSDPQLEILVRAVPTVLLGVVGAALGVSVARSADDVAAPSGQCAVFLGLLAVLVAVGIGVVDASYV